MAQLVYSAHTSLDGYTKDAAGSFDFTAPDEEVHAFVNDRVSQTGTFLFGRRMYETMSIWDTWDTSGAPRVTQEFQAIWSRADKVVYSTGLHTVGTRLTRVERTFDPQEVRALTDASTRRVEIGGATIAAAAFRFGLVDELELYLSPVMVGGGLRALPSDVRLSLSLLEEHHFSSGVVFLSYAVQR